MNPRALACQHRSTVKAGGGACAVHDEGFAGQLAQVQRSLPGEGVTAGQRNDELIAFKRYERGRGGTQQGRTHQANVQAMASAHEPMV